jgi:spore coat polysaccharide biosynthesis protein SpsF
LKNTIAIVQARLTSSRLPGKILKQIGNYTILKLIYLRLKQTRYLSKIVFAIPDNNKNSLLYDYIKTELNADVFTGNENDVLQRYRGCAETYPADYYVRITADCPFVLPSLVDSLVSLANEKNLSYVSNTCPPTFADGFDIEVFSNALLFYMDKNFLEMKEREHVTYGFLQRKNKLSKIFPSTNYLNPLGDYSNYRLTLDTEIDYDVILKIANAYKKDILYIQENECMNLYKILR